MQSGYLFLESKIEKETNKLVTLQNGGKDVACELVDNGAGFPGYSQIGSDSMGVRLSPVIKFKDGIRNSR